MTKERVKKLREKELRLTQEELAKSLGMSRANVCNIESGAVKLTPKNADLICDKFNVNHEWLLDGIGPIFKEVSEDDELALLIGEFLAENDPYKKKIIKKMLSLPDEDWHLMKRLADTFKD